MLSNSSYDENLSKDLVSGFRDGFKLGMEKTVPEIVKDRERSKKQRKPKNSSSALEHPDVVTEKLKKEIEMKRMIGPFINPPFQNYIISPLSLRQKKDPNKFRIIHDLSFPFGGVSVNSNIPTENGTVQYANMATAIKLIQLVGPGAVLVKTDIEHAYKLLPIHPSDVPALGLKWDNCYLWDCTLAMGSRSGCQLFEKFSTAVQHIAESKGCGPMCHILDDFLMVALDDPDADNKLETFLAICKALGIPVVVHKTEKGTCLVFMGVELDTVAMTARLPQEKIDKCLNLLKEYKVRKRITVHQLESLTGLLNFACSVVEPGKPFLRRLYQMLWGLKKRVPHYRLKLTAGAKGDMTMWEHFLKHHNGTTMFLPVSAEDVRTVPIYVSVDLKKGFGIIFGQDWFTEAWSAKWLEKKDNGLLLRLFPWMVVFKIFGEKVENRRLYIETSDKKLAEALNKQTDKDPHVMVVMRDLVLVLLRCNIQLEAHLVEKEDFTIADFLSSQQVERFKEEAVGIQKVPYSVPKELQECNYDFTSNSF